jgi:hypothetical protein
VQGSAPGHRPRVVVIDPAVRHEAVVDPEEGEHVLGGVHRIRDQIQPLPTEPSHEEVGGVRSPHRLSQYGYESYVGYVMPYPVRGFADIEVNG